MQKNGEVKRFVYEAWEICISLEATAFEQQASGHADLWHGGEHKCRVALSGHFKDDASACNALERKAKAWIDDRLTRDGSGETGFVS